MRQAGRLGVVLLALMLGAAPALARQAGAAHDPAQTTRPHMVAEVSAADEPPGAKPRRSADEAFPFLAPTDEPGSLGRILRVQAGDTRLKRQMLAEEKAMKAPIKMLFPTVAFIFPAMFIVILGPAFLNLAKIFQF